MIRTSGFEEDDGEFPFRLEGLDLPVVFYIRAMKEESKELKKQLNAILEHEAAVWEANIELKANAKELATSNSKLMIELDEASESIKRLNEEITSLREQNTLLDKRCGEMMQTNDETESELEASKEAAKSLQDKTYVMNEIMDDLMTACNCLYENLQNLLQDGLPPLAISNQRNAQAEFYHTMQAIRTSKMFGFGTNDDNDGVKLVSARKGVLKKERSYAGTPSAHQAGVWVNPALRKKLSEISLQQSQHDDDGMKGLSMKLKACADISTALCKQARLTH